MAVYQVLIPRGAVGVEHLNMSPIDSVTDFSVDQQLLRSLTALQPNAPSREIAACESLFAAGEAGDCFYAVLAGKVALEWSEGGPTEILGPGRVFGTGALVVADHVRRATATALEPTRVLRFNRETFLFALQNLPMFGLELLASFELRIEDLHRQSKQP